MVTALFVLAILLGLALLWAVLAKRNKPRNWPRQRVVAALANALDLDDSGYHDEFDLFLDGPLTDPSLEALRMEILAIVQNEEGLPGRDFGPNAEVWLRKTYDSLTHGGA
jgi:hypothetical protein